MPMKTAEKKLILPIICLLAVLAALSFLPKEGESAPFAIEFGGGSYFPLGDGFCAINSGGISAYTAEGESLFSEARAFDTRFCAGDGGRIAVLSEREVALYTAEGCQGSIDAPGKVLALAVRGEYMAVAAEDSMYASAVTFYEGTEPLFTRYLAGGECRELLLGEGYAVLLLPNELQIVTGIDKPARIALECGQKLLPTEKGFCVQTENALMFFSPRGEMWGAFENEFLDAHSFGDCLILLTHEGAISLDSRGNMLGKFQSKRILRLGSGVYPSVIMGEKTFVFDSKMELLYSIENKYIPLSVITDKGSALLCWQRAAQEHRK